MLVDHDVVRLQVSVYDAHLVMQKLDSFQDLFHDDLDLCIFVKVLAQLPTVLLDVIGQTHVHFLEEDVELLVIKLYVLGFEDVVAKLVRPLLLLYVCKPLEDPDFPLVKSLLAICVLCFIDLEGVYATCSDMGALVDMAEAT